MPLAGFQLTGTLIEKIVSEHCVEGVPEPGAEVAIPIDQTLTQDATGTMAYLEFEALEIPRVKTRLSVSYVDHNTLETGPENADDHAYLQTVAARYGILFSRPGNGISHQVHLERFSRPGETILGSDSHTPTAGGAGMLGIGAGSLDIAVAMAGGPFYMRMPRVVRVELNGKLDPWVSAKDIALEVLLRFGVSGGVGRALEYDGNGVKNLSVPERATVTNMGAETGATTSIFPSDETTLRFLEFQQRRRDWRPLSASENATYDETVEIQLDHLEPLVARPHSPGNVAKISELEGLEIDQIVIGSCTNSSLRDLMTVAAILRRKRVHPRVSLVVCPGSRQVLMEMTRNGGMSCLLEAGARVLEPACGPCIGMGQAPPSGGVSIRTFNRNFRGRSGTENAETYLVSPETAAVSAIEGKLADPRKAKTVPKIILPRTININDDMILKPAENPGSVQIRRGPDIRPLPTKETLSQDLSGDVLIKTGDNISTDEIMPAGAKNLSLRSNIPAIAEHVFERIDPSFVERAKKRNGGFVVAGENYGQGSSREHAASAPMFLGVRAVIAKSFARIHEANLVNFGIVPFTFETPHDYGEIRQGDALQLRNVRASLEADEKTLTCHNTTAQKRFQIRCDLSKRSRQVLIAGGLLNHTRLMTRNR